MNGTIGHELGAEWFLRRSGPAATNHWEAGGFIRSNDSVDMPNLMLTMFPLGVRNDGTPAPTEHSYQLLVDLQIPESKGSVKLRSGDRGTTRAHLQLSVERTRTPGVCRGRPRCAQVVSQSAFHPFDAGELSPGPEIETDDQILQWVANDAETVYHACGTCRMGMGPDAVIDPSSMLVHGIQGLRI